MKLASAFVGRENGVNFIYSMRFEVDSSYIQATLSELISINSVNPRLIPGAPGERQIANYVADQMERLGLEVRSFEPDEGRVSILGTRGGSGGGPSLMLNAHYDTVGVENILRPFEPVIHNGRMCGRGAYDMKASLAAILGAVKALAAARIGLRGDLLLAAVADEEYASLGTSDLLNYVSPEAAIVTEPTQLQICVAHKGFIWLEVETLGKAAHGSRVDLGIDANMKMGQFLAHLSILEEALRERTSHPLLGSASLHAATLAGGSELSAYAARCRLGIERRTLPGEDPEQAIAEIRAILQHLENEDPRFRSSLTTLLVRDPFEVQPDSRIVEVVQSAAQEVCDGAPELIGDHPWMDSALLSAAGIETVVFGPSGGGAHSAKEWVDLESVTHLAEILARSACGYCEICTD